MNKLLLLADDDHDDAELFGEALGRASLQVDLHYAEDAHALFKILDGLNNRKPDIIFLDINMPKIDGWECLAMLKKHAVHCHIPVVMFSTSSATRDKQMAVESGAIGLLTKPSDFKMLIKILTHIVNSEPADLKKTIAEIASF